MLRKLLVAPLFLASTLFCSANININWNHFGGSILQADATTPAPSTWLAQLIWSPSASSSAINVSNPLVPTGPDVVLYSQPLNTANAPGFLLGEVGSQSSADSTRAGGFIYTRVFNVDFGSSTIPTYYGQSANFDGPLVDVAANDPTATAHDPGRLVVGTMIVPEPGTYVLMAMGGAFLWFRRLRSK